MKDLMDFYSRFEERPVAFEDWFHAIREYESISVVSLDSGMNIWIYDKQKRWNVTWERRRCGAGN